MEIGWRIVRLYGLVRRKIEKEWINRKGWASYLSVCIDNCIDNSNQSYFRPLENILNSIQNKHISMSEQTIKKLTK